MNILGSLFLIYLCVCIFGGWLCFSYPPTPSCITRFVGYTVFVVVDLGFVFFALIFGTYLSSLNLSKNIRSDHCLLTFLFVVTVKLRAFFSLTFPVPV